MMKLLPAVLLAPLLSPLSAAEWKVTLHAGPADRNGSVVSFRAPEGCKGPVGLRGEDGKTVTAQVQGERVVFIEPQLAAGQSKTYTLASTDAAPENIKVETAGDVLKFATADGHPLFDYQMAAGPVPEGVADIFRHGAHLHPVFSPSGKVVTGNHPPDHRWHRGIWFAWTDTDFEGRHPDFWNMGKGPGGDKAGDKLLAEVRFANLTKSWGGPVQAGFVSEHRFIDHSSGTEKDVLKERWAVRTYRVQSGGHAANLIDLESAQTCASEIPLKLPKYHYGGLGVRGNALWDPVDAVTMLTSNGDDRAKGDSTKAKWVQMGGKVDGQLTGMTVLIHPNNFRFPQPLRLNPKNPQLCVAPSQDGDWSIEPGKPYVSRYRIVVSDGPADAAWLEKLWQDYAAPATTEVK
jgi:hypothetical protein